MSLHPGRPSDNPGAVERTYSDPRLLAFIDFIIAHDSRDARMGVSASRELRRLGYSICLTPARPVGGGR